MKRIYIVLKRHKKSLINVLIGIGLFICFVIINRLVNEHRGYKGLGGEVFIFLMPFIIVKLRDLVCDLISHIKKGG